MEREADRQAKREVLTLPRLEALARRTDRCVAASALREAGFSEPHIRSLERRGALNRVLWGVYAAGDVVLSTRQAMRVGLLAGGSGSVLAGRTAAEHLGLLPATNHELDIWVPISRGRRKLTTQLPLEDTGLPAIINLRRGRAFPDSKVVNGLPVPPVGLVLADLACAHGGEVACEAWREADFLRLLNHAEIEAVCNSGRPGRAIIRRLLEAMPIVQTDETDAQTKSEFALIEALLRLGVARPSSNSPMQLDQSWYFPDLWWKYLRAVVEVDGPIHRHPRRRAQDRLRDAHMNGHGIRVMRVDRDDVLADAEREARAVAAWLTPR